MEINLTVEICLSNHEFSSASDKGHEQFKRVITDNKKATSVKDDKNTLYNTINGHCGEAAVAKYLRLKLATIDVYDKADVEPDIAVKTTIYHINSQLILNEKDRSEYRYVLAVGSLKRFNLLGWCKGEYIKQVIKPRKSAYYPYTDQYWMSYDHYLFSPIEDLKKLVDNNPRYDNYRI